MSQSVLSDHSKKKQLSLLLHIVSQDSSNPALFLESTPRVFTQPLWLVNLMTCCHLHWALCLGLWGLLLFPRTHSFPGYKTWIQHCVLGELHFLPQIVCSHSYPPTLILSTYTHTSEFLLPSQYVRVHHFQLPCRCLHILVLSLTFTYGIAHNYNVTLTFDACQDQKILEVILMSHKRSTQLQKECPLNAKAQKSCFGPFEFPVIFQVSQWVSQSHFPPINNGVMKTCSFSVF